MNAHKRFELHIQCSIVHSKFQIMTHNFQVYSNLQYLLQVQVQAQQRYSNALTTKMIPYSHKIAQKFKVSEPHKTLTCMIPPISLPLFSNQHFIQLTKDNKGLLEAYSRVECKCMVI